MDEKSEVACQTDEDLIYTYAWQSTNTFTLTPLLNIQTKFWSF
jgi:hypothetical protein